jgi:hypothetical protein
VDSQHRSEAIAELIQSTDACDQYVGVVVACIANVVVSSTGQVIGTVRAVLEADAVLIYGLQPQSGRQSESAELDVVVDIGCKRIGVIDLVTGIAQPAEIVQHQAAIDLGVGAVALQPICLICVITQPDGQFMRYSAGVEAAVNFGLYASAVILAVVGAQLNGTGCGIRRAIDNGLQVCSTEVTNTETMIECIDDIGPTHSSERFSVVTAVKIDALSLEPVAFKLDV